MVMLDRRKLAAPLFAQAAAFVVVLVIGGFTGHAKTPSVNGTSIRAVTILPELARLLTPQALGSTARQ